MDYLARRLNRSTFSCSVGDSDATGSSSSNTAAGAAVQAALFSLQGINVQDTDGIIGQSTEQTVKNIGTLSHQGMVETDRTILKIMREKEKSRK